MSRSNSTEHRELVFPFGEQDETLEDVVMQIWNDGAEGIVYSKSDIKEFKHRIVKSIEKTVKGKVR